jgi:hypothetical protein
VLAIRGDVEDTSNGDLAGRVLVPIEHTIPEPARYTLFNRAAARCSITCNYPEPAGPLSHSQ